MFSPRIYYLVKYLNILTTFNALHKFEVLVGLTFLPPASKVSIAAATLWCDLSCPETDHLHLGLFGTIILLIALYCS